MEAYEIEELVNELETRIDRLRALYEQYFMGIEKLEPLVSKKDVDRRLQVLRREQIRNTALRFRFQMLIQKYTTYQSYWSRTCRRIEEGTFKRQIGGVRYQSVRPPSMSQPPPKPVFELNEDDLQEQGPSLPPANRLFSERPGGIDDDLDSAFAAIGANAAKIPQAPAVPNFERDLPKRTKSHPAMPSVQPPAYKPRKSSRPEMEAVRAERRSSRPASIVPGRGSVAPRPSSAPSDPKTRRERMIELAQRARRQQGSVFPVADPQTTAEMPKIPAAPRAPTGMQAEASREAQPPTLPKPHPQSPARPPVAAAPKSTTGSDLSDSRVREIYAKYVETKRQHQESTATITYEAVAKTLRESTERLKEKHKGKKVDFEVAIKDGKTVLKPIVK